MDYMICSRTFWVVVVSACCSSQAFFLSGGWLTAGVRIQASREAGTFPSRDRWLSGEPWQRQCRCREGMGITAEVRTRAGARRTGGKPREGGALSMSSLEEVPHELAEEVLLLEEADTGRTIECYAERFAWVDGKRYLAAFPRDLPVAIAFEEDGEVAPVPLADPLMDKVFPLAEACIKDLGPELDLLRTPTVLTVRGLGDADLSIDEQGEFDEDEEAADEDAGAEELGSAWSAESMGENVAVDEVVEGDEDDDNEAEEGFEDAEEVELLGEFTLEGEEFLLVRFVEPLLVLAKEVEGGRYLLLDGDEDEEMNPIVEEMLTNES